MGKQDLSTSSPVGFSSNVEDQWMLLLKDAEYSSYSVLALSPCHRMIAFGNLKGKIKLQDVGEWLSLLLFLCIHCRNSKLDMHPQPNCLVYTSWATNGYIWQFLLPADFNFPSVELQAYSGKVHNLLWSQLNSPQHLFSCGPDGQITWWNIIYCEEELAFDVTPLCSVTLPPSKQRWASAIEIFLDPSVKEISGRESWSKDSVVVVCGDRKGSLHLFDPKNATGSSQEASCFLYFEDS